jgi:hypothetical protein
MNTTPKVRIELTEQQRQQIKAVSGKDVDAIEFTAEELEQRVAPACTGGHHFPG